MYVKRLEVQGFKTFAKKTSLSFLAPKDGRNPVTTIVGPNGSGKSNMADAIRWVLGEQSLKTLRGKKSEDVIFSGTKKKGRSGMAEVSITFCNEDASMPLEVSEVTITRRLYRDGDGEYLVNNRKARLADIHLLLAQANVGQRSYSVIGQGMVDHILVSTPEERKAFFDDATGVRPLQLKRHSSMLKLKRTYENMAEVEMLLTEIEPRLRSLKRQANRLERRGQVQEELYKKEAAYYGAKWWGLVEEIERTRKEFEKIDAKVIAEKEKMATREEELAKMEREEKSKSVTDSGLVAMQGQYREKQKEKYKTREQQYEIRKKIELEKVKAQSSWTPLPLKDIIIELEEMVKAHQGLLTKVKGTKNLEEMGGLEALVDGVLKRSTKLVGRLQKPAPEDVKIDPVLQKELVELEKQEKATIAELKQLEQDMEARAKKQKTDRSHLFDLQRELRKFQHELYQLESKRNSMQIESARLEERQNALKREMDEHMKDRGAQVRVERTQLKINEAELYSEIQRLRYKLELIGGIDPEIIQEYEETKTRFEFLSEQVGDLKQAIEATEKVIDQLDKEIKDRGETVFKEINKEFQRFFKVLFGGGTCGLIKLTRDEVKEEVEVTPERVGEDTGTEQREDDDRSILDQVKSKLKEREDRIIGVDIHATPPGKKLKALNLLSGGERALTSIALVSAIMAVNPGPFVVLDEVDAALDEANTHRFANILEELQKLTQFIIITHNRTTMEKSDVLYGVTMGEDGVSTLLSVNISDIENVSAARG